MRLFRRTARILLKVVGGVLLLVLSLIGALVWYMKPPSDASLQHRFYNHRADLEQLVGMMEEDVSMDRIASDFTRNDDWAQRHGRGRAISDQRWNQYREIFRRAGVPKGTGRDGSGDIEIIAWTAGLAIAGTEMSYIHCGTSLSADLDNTYLPCVERKESGEFSEKDVFIRYKRIEGNWYIFEFSN